MLVGWFRFAVLCECFLYLLSESIVGEAAFKSSTCITNHKTV
jgi:hypothetical protein